MTRLDWRESKKRKDAARAKRMAARAAKQVVNSNESARTVSAETREVKVSHPQIVPGGLPGHGK
jgi:hypothetical protein